MKTLKNAVSGKRVYNTTTTTTVRLNIVGAGIFYGLCSPMNDYYKVKVDGVYILGNASFSLKANGSHVLMIPFKTSLEISDNAGRSFPIYILD